MAGKPKFAIAGGGTGGHLFPALSIADELSASGAGEIVFFGTARGPEARIVPQRGYEFHKIWIKGYPRRFKPEILLLPVKMTVSVLQCMFYLTRQWPDCLVATGGYVCLPFMAAGKLLGLSMVIHEQNSLPGVTTRIGAKWARAVFYSFEASARYFDYHPDAALSGNPVKIDFSEVTREEAIVKLGLDPGKKTLLVFGGSQGAATLNNAVSEVIGGISEKYNLIWGTGRGNLPDKLPPNALAREFYDDMKTVYAASDLAVCRAGAITLAEIAAKGLPAILVPFPFAAEDHQRLNAEPMAEAGAAVLILDREFDGEMMFARVDEILNNPGRLSQMSEKMRLFHRPQAVKMIAEKAFAIANHDY